MVPEIIPHKHHWELVRTDTLPQGNRRNTTGCNRSREGKAPARLGPNKPKLKRDLICVSNVTLNNTVVVHQMKYGKGGTVHGKSVGGNVVAHLIVKPQGTNSAGGRQQPGRQGEKEPIQGGKETTGSLKRTPSCVPLGLCVSRDFAGAKPEKSAALQEGLLGQPTHSVAVVQKSVSVSGLNPR